MKNYDFDKAKKMITDYQERLESAALGMHEDWFWTADTIWKDGEYTRVILTNQEAHNMEKAYEKRRSEGMSILSEEADQYKSSQIAGIVSSYWATPTIQLVFKDGTEEMRPCFVSTDEEEISDIDKIARTGFKQAMLLGCLSGPVQDNITPLSSDK